MIDRPLLRTGNVYDQMRAMLRTEFGYREEQLAAIPDESDVLGEDDIGATLANEGLERSVVRRARASLPAWIDAG